MRAGVLAIAIAAGACGSSRGGSPPDAPPDATPPAGFACAPPAAPTQHQAIAFSGYAPTTFSLVDLRGGSDGDLVPLGQLTAQSDRGFAGLVWSPDGSRAATYDQDQWVFSFRSGEPAVAPLATSALWPYTADGPSTPFSPSGCFVAELTFDNRLQRLDPLASGGFAPPVTITDALIAEWAPGVDRLAYVRGIGATQEIGVIDEHGAKTEWPIGNWNIGLWWVGPRWIVAQLGDSANPTSLVAIDTHTPGRAPIAITPSSAHVRFETAIGSTFIVTDPDTKRDTIVSLGDDVHELPSAHTFEQASLYGPQFFDADSAVAPSTDGHSLARVMLADDSEHVIAPSVPDLWLASSGGMAWLYAGKAWSYVVASGAATSVPCVGNPTASSDGAWVICEVASAGIYIGSLTGGQQGAFTADGDTALGSFRAVFSPDNAFVEFDRYATPHYFDLHAWAAYVPSMPIPTSRFRPMLLH